MAQAIELTAKEVADGKAPSHTSCKTVRRDGETFYVFSGRTGSKKPQKPSK